ncbi:helix-turn-helix domain-containing protein [Microvirga pudoricolor]|uniref:helix-turn-helix domain-containing protein n=1 Tax=Microvirga pudoricolor TaxID=2778729 RepID=UPI001951C5C8|nr:helix-turn-helix transcriptional regulator [Microvirga pudoricolor]MBM6593096.1 helix-turn-helix transcriptional regulator [Microvirga pudoricolor]
MSKKAPNALDQAIGAQVRIRRLQVSMSQEKLADALGLTFQQVQKYEKGTNRISVSRLDSIAKALGVDLAFFFESAQHPVGTGPAYPTDRDSVELVALFNRIPNRTMRKAILAMARAACEEIDQSSP